jgi:hypothetical protein
MNRRSYLVVACLAGALAWYWYADVGDERQVMAPIVIREGTVIVENRTPRDWRNVVVTVNDHFRGGTTRLAAGGRLDAPLSQFATSFGQRFDRNRQHVFKIEVEATDSAGEAVRLDWKTRGSN